MNKRDLIIYRIITAFFSVMMLMGAGMYFFNHAEVELMFLALGFPTYVIYPLGIAKVLGLVAIWSNKSQALTQWAYAGYAFVFSLAISGHLVVADGGFAGAIMALVLMAVSYIFNRKLYGTPQAAAA